jgi:hypothetical protein
MNYRSLTNLGLALSLTLATVAGCGTPEIVDGNGGSRIAQPTPTSPATPIYHLTASGKTFSTTLPGVTDSPIEIARYSFQVVGGSFTGCTLVRLGFRGTANNLSTPTASQNWKTALGLEMGGKLSGVIKDVNMDGSAIMAGTAFTPPMAFPLGDLKTGDAFSFIFKGLPQDGLVSKMMSDLVLTDISIACDGSQALAIDLAHNPPQSKYTYGT